jgi:hypothetical protein
MCKEVPVILVNRVVDPNKESEKNWKAKEEERHKGSLTKQNKNKNFWHFCGYRSGAAAVICLFLALRWFQ